MGNPYTKTLFGSPYAIAMAAIWSKTYSMDRRACTSVSSAWQPPNELPLMRRNWRRNTTSDCTLIYSNLVHYRSKNLKHVHQEPEPRAKMDHFKQNSSDTSNCAGATKNKGRSAVASGSCLRHCRVAAPLATCRWLIIAHYWCECTTPASVSEPFQEFNPMRMVKLDQKQYNPKSNPFCASAKACLKKKTVFQHSWTN